MINLKNIIFFDGYCVLCNGFVDFLIRIDKKDLLFFAALQGSTAKKILNERYLKIDTVVFKNEKGEIFVKSQAVLQILKTLGGFWTVFFVVKILPKVFLDFIYDKVAANRFDWFGKRNSCRLPDKDEKEKILP